MRQSEQIAALKKELRGLLGDDGVSTDEKFIEKFSLDGAVMSPVIMEQLPLGRADLVAHPGSAEQIGQVVAAAVRHGVPVTPRGKGTGNYGQSIPMPNGLVLDMSRAQSILEVGDGYITAEAGALILSLEEQARGSDQELQIYPSMVRSTIGGFLAGGSGGTGSIEHGSTTSGDFVLALDVVHATGSPELIRVEGEQARAYLHNYGTAGFIARATVKLEPLRDWRTLYASFEDFSGVLASLRPFRNLRKVPRLVSGDLPEIAAALPANPGIPAGRASLRAIVEASVLEEARAIVAENAGTVELVVDDPQEMITVSALSYNHPIHWFQQAVDETYFHVEVSGENLIDRIDEVHEVYQGAKLHIEAQHHHPIGMLAGVYQNKEDVEAGFQRLTALGVGYHNPHQWNVDFALERTVKLAAETDPRGLLNPGKLNPEYRGPEKGTISS